ncbi:hypothetical protein [Catellatospora chokoriensis]|uniref:Lipoprotein n=1 Tax=Catellatospora chokoriensis TaxID=310353 RepID=A0A8J3JMJ2_9ACTN|nr:hypothetical protein [Catellatospora chokoriensis]GIF87726.1 hypothetical protein Cch02nite_11700 [Catellatospora chokoriensis]
MRRPILMQILVLLALTACDSEGPASNGGPLVLGEGAGTLCLSAQPGTRVTIGLDIAKNQGDKLVTISDVSLINTQGLSLIEAVLVPVPTTPDEQGNIMLTGNWKSYPPPADRVPAEWNSRKAAKNASIDPSASWGFAFGLEVPAEGSIDGVLVDYADSSGDHFQARTTTRVLVKQKCS